MKGLKKKTMVMSIAVLIGLTTLPFSQAFGKEKVIYIEPGASEIEKQLAVQWEKDVKQEFPEVDFEINFTGWSALNDRLITMVMGGNAPDMLKHQDILELSRMGMFEPLNKWLDEKPISVTKDILVPSALDYTTVDGTIYLIPTEITVWGLAVREDWLNDAGFKLEDLRTWQDLLDAAQAMTKDTDGDGTIDQYGFVYPSAYNRFAWRHAEIIAHSNGFYLDEVESNEKGYLELLQFIKELQPYMPPAGVTWGLAEAYRAWSLGQVGMMVGASFHFGNIVLMNKETLEHTRFIPFPLGPSGTTYKAPLTSLGFGMFRASRNKEEAWKVVNYFCSGEKTLELGAILDYVPARKDVSAEDVAERAERFYSGIEDANTQWMKDITTAVRNHGIARKKLLGGVRIERTFTAVMSDFLRGKLSAAETYQIAKEKILEIKSEFE